MRVGVDVTPAISGRTGVARYTSSLVDGLRAAGIDVATFAIGRGTTAPPPGARHLHVPLRLVQQAWRFGVPLRAEHLSGPVDVVHSTDLVLPPTRRPLVATVHDTAALDAPQLHSAGVVRNARRRIAELRRADVVIANSGATATAIRSFLPRQEIVIVPMPPMPLPEPPTHPPVTGPYLLCVSEVTERKNHVALIRAFAAADVGDHCLVIAGPPGSAQSQVETEIQRLALGDRVVLLGFVEDEQLSGLYAGATALCLASRQEGFGIPLVEAMQRGLPIVATDLPAVREVAEPGALLVPVDDINAMAAAMTTIVGEPAIHDELAAQAVKRGDGFTLERTVAGTIAAYERAIEIAG